METNDECKQCSGSCNLLNYDLGDVFVWKCKICKAAYDKIYREKNKDRLAVIKKVYRDANKNRINIKARDILKNRTPEEIQKQKDYLAAYYIKHKDKIKKATKNNKNRPGARQNRAKRERERYKNDPQYRLEMNARSRIRKFIKDRSINKSSSVSRVIGCSREELAARFEFLFYDNLETGESMTWDNDDKWDIDHIVPLSYFNMADPEQFAVACHYLNLRPLWRKENLEKSAKVPENAEEIIGRIKETLNKT